ncbi:TauD/TfdA family dioxygenase [Yinghuangia aomiensis]
MATHATGSAPAPELHAERLSSALGALVTGVDLATDTSDATVERLQELFLEHQVLCIRGQQAMTSGQQLDFRGTMGRDSRCTPTCRASRVTRG